MQRHEGCISSRVVAMTIGGLSIFGSIIGGIRTYVFWLHNEPHYIESSFTDSLPIVALAMLSVLQGFSAVLMMIGAKNGKAFLMFPWLGTHATVIMLCISGICALLMNGILVNTDMRDPGYFFATLCAVTVITAISIGLFAGVYNHYHNIVSGKFRPSSPPYMLSEPIVKSDLTYEKV